ncbi:MAG: DNA mismatch repair protein MutS, partial [Chitinophagaceae bacterium]|nr:DNA mismatch repair protein MutS [Chitinophagaceae bacterium]
LQAIGQLEAMSSLANLRQNQPLWAMPTLSDEPGTLQARQLGHPLLPEERRVCSDFSSMGLPQISVITGSNMAGKSTFLRSVGVAFVLAHAGAPVCASHLLFMPS